MLNKSDDIPYEAKSLTIIYKVRGEWYYCTSKSDKRWVVENKAKVQEIMCAWTGQWSTSIFEVDWDKLAKV